MATGNLDERNLTAVVAGGQIHEDVMDRIFYIDPIDLPFTDMIGRETSSNHYKEWVEEELEAADGTNATIDGADAGADESVTGRRVGNYHQMPDKVVKVSDRARNVNAIGTADQLIHQLMRRQQALRRDVEAALTGNVAALPGDASNASLLAGIGAWIGSKGTPNNASRGATGTAPALSGTTGGYPDTAPGAGTKRALTETLLASMLLAAYTNGGNVTHAMSVPSVIKVLSDYMFTSSARIATLQSNVAQSNRTIASSGNGAQGGGVVAQGSVNIYVSNWGTVIFTPNRFQPDSASGAADLFLIDPSLWAASYLQGYETKELARSGTAENRQITCDVTLIAKNEYGNAVVADIDYTLAMTA